MSYIRKISKKGDSMPKFTVLVLLFTFSILGYSQEIEKIAIEVEHTGDDALGATLSFKLKENINSSSEYRVTYSDEPRFVVVLVTVDAIGASGSTVCSYSFIFSSPVRCFGQPMFITSSVGVFGRERIENAAEMIIANLDKSINEHGLRNSYLVDKHIWEGEKGK